MTHITEDQLEQAALGWFRELGYQAVFGPNIAPPPDGVAPERDKLPADHPLGATENSAQSYQSNNSCTCHR